MIHCMLEAVFSSSCSDNQMEGAADKGNFLVYQGFLVRKACEPPGVKASHKKLWSRKEDKAFENALAIYSGHSNRWEKITAAVPGRTIEEIKDHFEVLCADVEAIHSGCVPLPQYEDSSMKSKSSAPRGGKNNQSKKKPSQSSQGEGSSRINGRKKGVPWTSEEHRLFLEGLKKYGRGDWRSISRLCVFSRTSTQVASHAQKYFKRLDEIAEANERASIHDMSNLNDGETVTEGTLPEGQEGVKEAVVSLGKFPTLDSSYKGSKTCFKNKNIGVYSSSYQPSENSGIDDLHHYPGTGQSDSDISVPKWPGTEQGIGNRQPGLNFGPGVSQEGTFNPQGTSTLQMIGFSDADFIADDWMVDQHGISLQEPSYAQQTVAPPINGQQSRSMLAGNVQEQTLQGPMSAQQIGAPTVNAQERTLDNLMVTSQDYFLTPEGQSFVQTVDSGWESYGFNFGESASASGSSFNLHGHPTTSEWLQPPVAPTVAESDNFCTPNPMMYDPGTLDYGPYSPTAIDLAELEFCFSPPSGQI